MLPGLVVLLTAQGIGVLLSQFTGLPLPAPIVGLVLFWIYLGVRRPSESAPEVVASESLLKHLQLLYVPAGVGVVAYLDTVQADALALVLGLVGSWAVALVTTALVAKGLLRVTRGSAA